MSIPASEIVSVTPSVLSAGGNPLSLSGLILTEASALPTGAPKLFATASAVSDYFGVNSTEAAMASVYFNGFTNSNKKPDSLYFSRFPASSVAAFIRGGEITATLAELKATPTTSTMSIVVDGSVATCSNADLAGAASFSAIATLLTSAFTGASAPTVTYDSTFGAFVMTSDSTGDASTVAFATGTLAAILKMTSATGAVLSQGRTTETPTEHMAAIPAFTQNWVMFTTTFEPSLADKKLFGGWSNLSGNRYLYVAWDTDLNAFATAGEANTSYGNWTKLNNVGGSIPIYSDAANGPLHAAFVLGTTASIDFEQTDGRITFAFKSQEGLVPVVTDATKATTLMDNGYNFYGSYATANDAFVWLYNGQVSGQYGFIDTAVNAVWLNNQIQLALMTLLASRKSIPYNEVGYSLVRSAIQDPVVAAVNFGAIRGGVPLSAAQASQVNAAAAVAIDQVLASRGWYLKVSPATAQVRAIRATPPCTLWYMDGGSIHKLNIASIAIQ